ncbi:hypothetical protein CIG1485E_a0068 (plasmid) [Campylobacter iguaniorum]|uniref:Uncharacterized protein n=1 Tax=Campylobacter iguaniorum TaxID=1244531 RepID=A0A076FD61_9BACT|nr:hypothetical protein [Campylobacter iguaniorum]AII15593.1 hypothetical protein CIG1485E_a0068 [Campylobacter iguaniorum]
MNKMKKQKNYQPSLFDTLEKIEKSTSTIDELRVPIFAPVIMIAKNSGTYKEFIANKNVRKVKTKWGEVEIRNRLLTQIHKDLLDLIFSYAKETRRLENGKIVIYFSQSEIMRHYGDLGKNLKWFREKLSEIRDAVILYRDNKGNEFDFNIIANKAFDFEQDMFGIILDDAYVKFYENGLSIDYKNNVPELLKVGSPLLRSIIRFFFTHNSLNLNVDDVLHTIGFPMESTRTVQLAKKELKESQDILGQFFINYDVSKRIFYYKGHKSVSFLPSITKEDKEPSKERLS